MKYFVVAAILLLAVASNSANGFNLFSMSVAENGTVSNSSSSSNSSDSGSSSSSSNSSDSGSSSGYSGAGSGTRTVTLLVRKVDDRLPYYRSMFFRVPLELNYALPAGSVLEDLKNMLSMHCNTTNITQVVLNDLIILNSDSDVMRLKNAARIEIWSRNSGMPTRARTAAAFAKGSAQIKSLCMKMMKKIKKSKSRSSKKSRRGQDRRRDRSEEEEEDRIILNIDNEIDLDEPIVVPDFDGDGERDSD